MGHFERTHHISDPTTLLAALGFTSTYVTLVEVSLTDPVSCRAVGTSSTVSRCSITLHVVNIDYFHFEVNITDILKLHHKVYGVNVGGRPVGCSMCAEK